MLMNIITKIEQYEEYVKKYAVKMGISEAEASTHQMVKGFWKYLNEEDVEPCKNLTKIEKSITTIACDVDESC